MLQFSTVRGHSLFGVGRPLTGSFEINPMDVVFLKNNLMEVASAESNARGKRAKRPGR